MKLFLDDIRIPPEGWELVRNYSDCIFRLSAQEYEAVSLDYSLGERFTGLDVLKWMAERRRFPKTLNIHSTHPYGKAAMADYVRAHFPQGYPYTVKSLLY